MQVRTRLALLLLVLALTGCALFHREARTAAPLTYYVSKAGSDSNSCSAAQSQSSPKQTLNAGIACMQGGDTLVVGAGTYAECLSNSSQFTTTPLPAGAASAPTTLRAAAGGSVWLKPGKCPADRESGGIIALEGNSDTWFVVEGINVDGSGAGGTRQGVTVSARRNVFRNLTIQNVERQCLNSFAAHDVAEPRFYNLFEDMVLQRCGVVPDDVGSHGAYINSWNNTFNRLTARDNNCNGLQLSSEGGQSKYNVVKNSQFYGNGCTGIVTFPGNTLFNNILHDNKGYGIDGYPSEYYNNIVYHNSAGGISLKGNGHTLQNNIVLDNGSPAGASGWQILDADGGGWSGTASHNVCNATGADNPGCTAVMSASAIFVDAPGGNFQHKASSPAKEAGTTVSVVQRDIVDRERTAVYDLGAYEGSGGGSGGTTPPPAEGLPAPTNLTATVRP